MTRTQRPTASKGNSGMTSSRKTALAVGVLFILTFITSIAAVFAYGPVLTDPAYILSANPDTGVFMGAFLELLLIITNIGCAVVLFPLLKRQNEGLALGYVTARLVECGFIAVGLLSLLTVATLASGDDQRECGIGRPDRQVARRDAQLDVPARPGLRRRRRDRAILGWLMYRSGGWARAWRWSASWAARCSPPPGSSCSWASSRRAARCRASRPSRRSSGRRSWACTCCSRTSSRRPSPRFRPTRATRSAGRPPCLRSPSRRGECRDRGLRADSSDLCPVVRPYRLGGAPRHVPAHRRALRPLAAGGRHQVRDAAPQHDRAALGGAAGRDHRLLRGRREPRHAGDERVGRHGARVVAEPPGAAGHGRRPQGRPP